MVLFFKVLWLLLLISFLLSYLLTPLARRFSIRMNILDHPSERKIHATPTPRLGGIAIFISFCLCSCLYFMMIYQFSFKQGYLNNDLFVFSEFKTFLLQLAFYFIGAMLMLIIGMLDDIKMIDYRLKFIVQILSASIIVSSGEQFQFFQYNLFNIVLSLFWIVGITNSLNLLDNMNGLASGLSAIILGFFATLAYFTNHPLLALYLAIPIGCLLGFLPYNFPKAKIFLGDGGSLFIGFSLATFSIWLFKHLAQQQMNILTILSSLLLLASIPILDTLTVIFIRIKNRKPIYVGDMNHLSHQLVRVGFSSTSAVMILYACAFVIGTVALFYVVKSI